jgi:Ser/Thr protein kinase RdoA (MazF antagonist)
MLNGQTADNLNFVGQMVADQYGDSPQMFSKLQLYTFDWRGIYRVEFAHRPACPCVLRLSEGEGFQESFLQTGQLLLFLERQGYPAPRVRLTRNGAAVGSVGEWHMLMLTYVEGERATLDPDTLRVQARVTAQLHSLPPAANLRDSRWQLDTVVDHVSQHLTEAQGRSPVEVHAMNEAMLSSLDSLKARVGLPVCLIHGDCWYMNAVRNHGQVTLIDWDQAGKGPAVLDLAYLLLTSHYDLTRPLEVTPSQSLISAIVHGYSSRRQMTDQERAALFDVIRLVITFAASRHYAEHDTILADDFVVQKIKTRFDATEEIAEIAGECLRNT